MRDKKQKATTTATISRSLVRARVMARIEVRSLNYATPNRVVDYVDDQIERLRPLLPEALGKRLIKVNPEVLVFLGLL